MSLLSFGEELDELILVNELASKIELNNIGEVVIGEEEEEEVEEEAGEVFNNISDIFSSSGCSASL